MTARRVDICDGLRIGFPGRDADFHDAVELGVLAAHLALRPALYTRDMPLALVDQARKVAEALGYRVRETRALPDGGMRLALLDASYQPAPPIKLKRAVLRVVQ